MKRLKKLLFPFWVLRALMDGRPLFAIGGLALVAAMALGMHMIFDERQSQSGSVPYLFLGVAIVLYLLLGASYVTLPKEKKTIPGR
jgi:hypothetical protein